MTDDDMQAMIHHAMRAQLAAHKVISDLLAELISNRIRADHLADAIIARLVNHDPPIFLVHEDEMKEDE